MIVKPTTNGWEIIYHRAHALLAAQIAGHWQRTNAPPRLYETIAAISHHDDLEREWGGDHLTEAGAPMDFTLSEKTSVPQLRKLIDSALYRGRWVALLISMHLSRLNSGKRGESTELDQFLDEQIANQDRWRTELAVSKDDAVEAYAFMQWCDRFSLILCQHELPADQRALEISKGPDGTRYDVIQRSDGSLSVTPWCFEPDQFTINVEAHCLSQLKFENNTELTQALQQSPTTLLEWTFIK